MGQQRSDDLLLPGRRTRGQARARHRGARDRQRLAIPVVASLGGMALPIVIFTAFNAGGSGAHAWGAAMSTDTALALGVLGLACAAGDPASASSAHDRSGRRPRGAGHHRDRLHGSHRSVPPARWPSPSSACSWDFATCAAPGGTRRPSSSASRSGWRCSSRESIRWSRASPIGLVTSAYPPERGDLERVTEQARSFREQPTPRARAVGPAQRRVGDLGQRAAPIRRSTPGPAT